MTGPLRVARGCVRTTCRGAGGIATGASRHGRARRGHISGIRKLPAIADAPREETLALRPSPPPRACPMRPLLRLVPVLSWLVVAAPLAAQSSTTPSVDDIIARYVQRVGGEQRLHAVVSIRRHGKYYGGGGFEADVTNESRRPNKIREEFAFGGLTGVTAYDGKNGW